MAILMTSFLSSSMSTATVIVPVSETDLTRQASAIVVGTVNTIESYWDPEVEQIFTYVTLTPQEVLKGTFAPGNLTLKQLGGTVGNRRVWLDGAPDFTRGEKVLLFLDHNPDGSARVAQLYLGKFSLFTDRESGKEIAYRSHAGAGVSLFPKASSGNSSTLLMDDEFQEVTPLKARIHSTLQSAAPADDTSSSTFAPLQRLANSAVEPQENFVLVNSPPIRWFEPDAGDAIVMSINPGNIFAGGENRVATGFQTWNAAPDSVFRFRRGNDTNAKGFRSDGVNAISFSDPLNDLPNPIRCTGVLAAVVHTGLSDDNRVLHDQVFSRITEADLVFADGWENCDVFHNSTNLDEVATHELGHVLGLGHSPNPDSIMFAFAHFDGRGARLAPEDADGVAFLYPSASFPTCSYTLSSAKRSISGQASTGKVSVSTNNRCGWTAFTNTPWITIVEGVSSSGDGTVVFAVAANTSRQPRHGKLMIAGQTFTLTQRGTPGPSRKRPPPFVPG